MTVERLQVGEIGTNCYLLSHGGELAVVDPGGSAQAVLAAIDRSGGRLTMVLLTHGHFDHTGAVEALRAAYPNVPIYLHPMDRACLGTFVMPSLGPTVDYDEGEVLSLAGLAVRVLHTPGHTPGGVCLLAGDALFTGDTLFRGSMGRTDLGGDAGALYASLARLYRLEGDYTVYPGHEAATTLETERRSNYYMRDAVERGT